MTELYCKNCKKMIINDIENYLKNYPNEKWIQCCYCSNYISIENIKKEVN